MCQWKNFENRSKFNDLWQKNSVAYFFDSRCIFVGQSLKSFCLSVSWLRQLKLNASSTYRRHHHVIELFDWLALIYYRLKAIRVYQIYLHSYELIRRHSVLGWVWLIAVSSAISLADHVVLTCQPLQSFSFLPARRYASAGLCDSDVSVCLSVCHTPILCLAERKQDREMYTVW